MFLYNVNEIPPIRDQIRAAAAATRHNPLCNLDVDEMEALYTLKFGPNGNHPLNGNGWNFIEQTNQTFTIMATLAAAEYLLNEYPECGGLELRLANAPGRDIRSVNPNVVEAETFTVGEALFRRELRYDINRFIGAEAENCFIFYYCHANEGNQQEQMEQQMDLEQHYTLGDRGPEVQIWRLSREQIM